jgi:hypothetical protein
MTLHEELLGKCKSESKSKRTRNKRENKQKPGKAFPPTLSAPTRGQPSPKKGRPGKHPRHRDPNAGKTRAETGLKNDLDLHSDMFVKFHISINVVSSEFHASRSGGTIPGSGLHLEALAIFGEQMCLR